MTAQHKGTVSFRTTPEMDTQITPDAQRRIGARVAATVIEAGLEHEYCLLYGGQICFHSPSRADCDAHERANPLCFTKWCPELM